MKSLRFTLPVVLLSFSLVAFAQHDEPPSAAPKSDADNRPRMAGKMSPDGKTVEFDFLDVSGHLEYGHMQHAVFTIIDPTHHIEDWTYMQPGDKPVHAHFDLQRTK